MLNGEGLDFGLDFEVGTSMQHGNTVRLHLEGLLFVSFLHMDLLRGAFICLQTPVTPLKSLPKMQFLGVYLCLASIFKCWLPGDK